MDTYVVDTHSLVWFITEDDKLSKRAERVLDQAEAAEVEVLVPTIILAEITYIAQRKKVEITIDKVLERIREGDGFAIVPFDFSVFQMTLKLPEEWEIHDRIIAATASYYGAKLVTRDEALQTSNEVDTVW